MVSPHFNNPASVDIPPRLNISINSISITDESAINNPMPITVVINCSNGLLCLKDANGNDVLGSGTNSITITDLLPNINNILKTLIYEAVPGRMDIIYMNATNQNNVRYSMSMNIVVNPNLTANL